MRRGLYLAVALAAVACDRAETPEAPSKREISPMQAGRQGAPLKLTIACDAALHALVKETGGPPIVKGADGTFTLVLRERIGKVQEHSRPPADADKTTPIEVRYPRVNAMFPPEFLPPTFIWDDASPADMWWAEARLAGGQISLFTKVVGRPPAIGPIDRRVITRATRMKPDPKRLKAHSWKPTTFTWDTIKACSVEAPAKLTLRGYKKDTPDRTRSVASFDLSTAPERTGAPIFFRDVPLPFKYALKNLEKISWRLGEVGEPGPAQAVMEGVPFCANCHSFSADGNTLALDVDYGSDKGSYAITDIEAETTIDKSKLITWSDYKRDDGEPTFGLLSQISPDGRYVLSTVKDLSVFIAMPDLAYSQLFFPVRGIIAIYDREAKTFTALRGADDPAFVQSNPVWSPDGQTILFARAKAAPKTKAKTENLAVVRPEDVGSVFGDGGDKLYDATTMNFEGGRKFRYDIYQVPFNKGLGGVSKPLPGASENGKSNFFPRYSPDGKWIVFTQSDSFMLLRADSELFIMSAAGGKARRLLANVKGKMNSWHSWSPNGRWLVYSSKATGPYTRLWLTHIDAAGQDSVPVLIDHFLHANRAANIPEFMKGSKDKLKRITAAFADEHNYFRLGLQYWHLADYQLAIENFQEAVKRRPDHVESHAFLGRALMRKLRKVEGVKHLAKAVELKPEQVELRLWLALAQVESGAVAAAIATLQRGHEIDAGHPDVARTLAWLWATAPDGSRNGAKALILAREQVKNAPTAEVLATLAAAQAERGDFKAALKTVTRAEKVVPTRKPKLAATLRAMRAEFQLDLGFRNPGMLP